MKYIKEDVESMLRMQKKNEAKILELDIKIEECKNELYYAGSIYEESDKEVIEGKQLSNNILEIPTGKTNRISNKTENIALSYQKDKVFINNKNRADLKNKLVIFEEQKERLDKKVVRVKNMLNQLPIEEKFVIETYYMEKSKWDYVEKKYFEEFELHKTIKQLQRYRENALDSMLDVINTGLKEMS